MKRKNMNSKKLTNRKMNDDVYALRSEVMAHIYEAKALLGGNMARVDVRITEDTNSRVLGMGRMGDKIIWLPTSTVKKGLKLRHVVFHELLHALFAVEHNETCALMASVVQKTTKVQQNRLFKKHALQAA